LKPKGSDLSEQFTHEQHIVPHWHLRRFASDDGSLWRYMRNESPVPRRPKKECWERDFYEFEVNGKSTNNRYEKWLGRIENDAAPLLDKLVNRQQFDPWESRVWAYYVATLFLRTQKVRAQFSARMVEEFRRQCQRPEFVRDLQYDLFKDGALVYADDLRRQIEQLRSDMECSPSYYHLLALRHHAASLSAVLLAKRWHAVDAAPGKFFVFSDCPVTTVEIAPGQACPGPGFAKHNAVVILPITPQTVFVASSAPVRWNLVGSPAAVESTNRLTVGFAHRKVYAHVDSLEIRGLVDRELNQIEFGKDAFVPESQN
jgi:hypothetical protein